MPLFKALPTGTIVGTTDTQTLTNKTLSTTTFTGDITQSKSGPFININKAASGEFSTIQGQMNGSNRWGLVLGDNGTESGSNNGSSLAIYRYADNAAFIDAVLTASRVTGGVSLRGTNTNDSAAASFVGEEIRAALASGSAVSLTTATPKTVTSLSLTAGDWDISGIIHFTPGGTTSMTVDIAAISTVTNALTVPSDEAFTNRAYAAQVPGANLFSGKVGPFRVSISGTTNYFLVAQATFTVSTLTAYGVIRARRVR